MKNNFTISCFQLPVSMKMKTSRKVFFSNFLVAIEKTFQKLEEENLGEFYNCLLIWCSFSFQRLTPDNSRTIAHSKHEQFFGWPLQNCFFFWFFCYRKLPLICTVKFRFSYSFSSFFVHKVGMSDIVSLHFRSECLLFMDNRVLDYVGY